MDHQVLLQQLGGRKFTTMTGAKNFVYSEKDNWLSFRLPSRFATDGINYVKITLVNDLYTMEFGKVWGTKYTKLHEIEGVYCDMLQSIFTKYTGLDTHL
jgi:hypothetical protein